MSLPAVLQHLRVLEDSGLVRTEKVGRVRTCRMDPAALRTAEHEMSRFGRRRSVSVQTAELSAGHGGTRLVLTDQGVYLDGLDNPEQRRAGIGVDLDQLGKALTDVLS
jgi:hypothetical protein